MALRIGVRRKEPVMPPIEGGGGATTARRRKPMSLTMQRTLEGYFFVAPWVLGFLVFMAWPLFQSFYLSFHELQATSLSDLKFRGLDNYKEAFFIDSRFLP